MSGPDGRFHADDLLTAHLDGELRGPEETWVTAHLAACAECRAAAEQLAAARELLRSLPLVDASPMVEGILARHRHLVRAGAVFVGLTAATLGIVALTAAVVSPVVVPDVAAMAAAHAEATHRDMSDVHAVDDVRGMYLAPAGVATSTGTIPRSAVYAGHDLTVVVYGDGEQLVSIYEQPGSLDWDALPVGHLTDVAGRRLWMSDGVPRVGVTELGHLVVTLVSDREDAVRAALAELPERRREGLWDRVHDACQRFTSVFAFGH